MSMMKEFREFALKGNVMDLAVGVIIGAAFGKIVTSLVDDVIMPVVGRIFGGLDFTNYYLPLADVPAGNAVMAARLVQSEGPPASKTRDTNVPVDAYGVTRIQSTERAVPALASLTPTIVNDTVMGELHH